MVSAKNYITNYDGDKEKAVQELERWIQMYKDSPKKQTLKTAKRIEQCEQLITEINAL